MRLIDADELKEHKFVGVQTGELDEIPIKAYQQGWNDAIDAIIDNAPTVDTTFKEVVAYECGQKSVERPTGHWIPKKDYDGIAYWKCSECKVLTSTRGNFCPVCGADMRKEAEDV